MKYIAAIDQGTTSTRCIIFDHAGNVVAIDQKEHQQIYPQPGWVEHDLLEIWANTQAVIQGALAKTSHPASCVRIYRTPFSLPSGCPPAQGRWRKYSDTPQAPATSRAGLR